MNVDFNKLKKVLAENKVFDSWQYVYSLIETINYMNESFELLKRVYNHRVSTLKGVEQEIYNQAFENKGTPASLPTKHLERTNLNIAGYEIDDSMFLRKTALEFFHYARLCVDVLSQIVNSSLFGDDAFPVTESNLPAKVSIKLGDTNVFSALKTILFNGISEENIKYLFAFDNYTKHIKTILITVSTSIFIGNVDKFEINSFCYKGVNYPQTDALKKTKDVHDTVMTLIENTLNELFVQVPNCINNNKRFHTLKFKQLFKETDEVNILQYMVYFMEVKTDLSELPSEIKVMPLLINSNNEVCSYVLDLDEIFITTEGNAEQGIIGIARFSGSGNSNELYRPYKIEPCTMHEFHRYVATFAEKYNGLKFNSNAIEGEAIFIKG